ncbi:MAG TPA: hypothetical protein VKE96_24840 [Vicinamibacterales bacterium]|nr:hypothetical protein [Vicinamibacterales bacterium]
MSPTALFGVQFTFSLVVFAAVAVWYIGPALRSRPVTDALVPLFLVHALRYLPSSAFAPGQIDPRVPADAMSAIAFGDLASAVLALLAAVFLHYRWTGALAVAWVVNVVTSIDWLYAGFLAASRQLVTYPMGGNWYIINYYVPVIGVIHVMIFARLLEEARLRGRRAGAAIRG